MLPFSVLVAKATMNTWPLRAKQNSIYDSSCWERLRKHNSHCGLERQVSVAQIVLPLLGACKHVESNKQNISSLQSTPWWAHHGRCREAVVKCLFVLGPWRNSRDKTFLKVSTCGVYESLNTTASSLHVVMPRAMATSSTVSGFLATMVAETSSLPSVFVTLIAYALLPGYFAASAYLVSGSLEYFLFNHRILACLLSFCYVACMLRGIRAIEMKSRRNASNRAFASELP